MNLEQRVEALEIAVKALVRGDFTVENGQVFINEALIRGDAIKAAAIHAAEFKIQS
ncbi:phage tail tip fiber protein [Pantoea septica]|uniref:phage tail tip fiber protein n=1 Tax=Pantoea septica TaxID=472695 RepID=UPI001301E876|nr:hypothetical protein [Pantoea septica]